MSLRVHLLFNLPQYPITGISIFLLIVGVGSIAATVFGFIEVIWGSFMATGAWGGGVAVITGLYGAAAANSKGVCSVTSFTVIAFFCCLVSIGQGVMSAAGLEFHSGFYPNAQMYSDINEGHTKLIHSLLLGTAGLQFILALILALICTRHICIGRKREKTNQTNILYGTSPFQRGNERASSSSQAPLVGGTNRKKPKKKRNKSKPREQNTPSSSACIHHQTFTDSEQKIRGRRFGNMPVAGANIVEAQNFSGNNSRNASMRGHRSFSNANESTRSSRRRQRPPLPLQGSRYDQETQGLLAQVQNKLALESGDSGYVRASPPEIIVPRASVSEFDLLDEASQNQNNRAQNSPNFIPITDTVNDPLSIEDDDELPPYEENPVRNVRLYFPPSFNRTYTDEDIQSLENIDRHSDTISFNSELHSTSTFQSEERPSITGNVRPLSYFEEPQNLMRRERSHTLGSVPIPQLSLPNQGREKLVQDFFKFGEEDPQGVSYGEFTRTSDKIIAQEKPKPSDDSKYSAERALQRENSLKSNNKPNITEREHKHDFLYSKTFFTNEADPRRLSKASTVSLPAGFAPPKPPRIFTVEMSSLQSPLHESQEIVKSSERRMDHSSIDMSQVVLRRKKPINKYISDDSGKTKPTSSLQPVQGDNVQSFAPLSVKTSQPDDHYSTFSNTKPYAQSSPKLKALEQLTLPTMSPCLSPLPNTVSKEDESSFTANLKDFDDANNMNRKSAAEKKRRKLDVKGRDPHPLSLLPYLTKSVSEFTNGNNISGVGKEKRKTLPKDHRDTEILHAKQSAIEDSDEELKKFLGIKCNSESVSDRKEIPLRKDPTSEMKSIPSLESYQEHSAAGRSRDFSGEELQGGAAVESSSADARSSHRNASEATGSRNKPIYSILL